MKTWDEDNKNVHGEIFAKNILALSFIHRGLSLIIFPRVMAATTAHDAWKILQDAYKDSEKVISIKFQTLWKEFDTLSMKEDETIQIFFDGVTNICLLYTSPSPRD